MQSPILLLLYGLSSWGAGLNCQAWGRSLLRHWRTPRPKRWWRDDTLLIRIGLTLLSAGVAGLAGTRLEGVIFRDIAIQVPSSLGILFIGLMACAEPFFLRVDENHAQADGHRSLVWRLYWAGSISAVTLFVVAVVTGALP